MITSGVEPGILDYSLKYCLNYFYSQSYLLDWPTFPRLIRFSSSPKSTTFAGITPVKTTSLKVWDFFNFLFPNYYYHTTSSINNICWRTNKIINCTIIVSVTVCNITSLIQNPSSIFSNHLDITFDVNKGFWCQNILWEIILVPKIQST